MTKNDIIKALMDDKSNLTVQDVLDAVDVVEDFINAAARVKVAGVDIVIDKK